MKNSIFPHYFQSDLVKEFLMDVKEGTVKTFRFTVCPPLFFMPWAELVMIVLQIYVTRGFKAAQLPALHGEIPSKPVCLTVGAFA